MWWISFCCRIRGLPCWNGTISFWPYLSWRERPPERIDRRPTGRDKHDQRQRQYQQTLDELRHGPSFIVWILHRPPTLRQRRLLLRALQIALMLATSGAVPNISLSRDRSLRQRLRRYKHRGFLGTTSIKDKDMTRLRQVLSENEPQSLYSSTNNDNFQLIVDTGCSHSTTGCETDFLPGTIHTLESPLEMEGIAGGLQIRQKGRVLRYELLTDDGDVHVLETKSARRILKSCIAINWILANPPISPSHGTTVSLLGKLAQQLRCLSVTQRTFRAFASIETLSTTQKP
jgi:hypothetical protein